MKRTTTIALIIVAALAGMIGAFAIQWSATQKTISEAPFGVAFNLVDQNGQPITEKAFQGKPTTLFFGYTHCPDVCPTTLFELNGWMNKVDPDGTKMQGYFVTVDPDRDTPELLATYISNVTKRVLGISGPSDKVLEMAKGFKVYYKKVPIDEKKPDGDYTMDHTASVFLLDSKGRFSGTISYGEDPEVAVKKLQNLMNK